MRTSVVLAVVVAIVMIELVTIAASRRMWENLTSTRAGATGDAGRARNATKSFISGVKKRIEGYVKLISSYRLSRIGDVVRRKEGRAAQALGVDELITYVRNRLGRGVEDLTDTDLEYIVQAADDTFREDIDEGDLDLLDDDK
ncbi:hypothetical protein RRG08_012906 [Elysia crispata]|uniref:Uncharacterized protein n=1 Tax=Elysia crispata TaxID=231223 RepID=A0AAE0YHF0_9GAST|nr:hypothetical protein RRG08_012906 [Elysia crispata]